MEPEEYVDSVRLRLGCAGPCEPVPCAACQNGSLDTGAAHATCCAVGEATRGHNEVTTLVHAAAQSCDCTAGMEVLGLIPGTDLRPADVLTSALGNSHTALRHLGLLPARSSLLVPTARVQTRHESKLAHYGPHLPSFLRQNISHTPIVWSACGRPHRDTLTVLRPPSKSIARKRDFVSAEVVYQKLHASITLEIWKRSAQQIRASWPLGALPDSVDPESQFLPGALRPSLSCAGLLSCVVSPACSFLDRVFSDDVSLISILSRFTCSVLGLGQCPARSPSAAWPRSCPLSPLWKPRLCVMFRRSWKRLRNLWSRSRPRGLSLVSRTSVPTRAPALSCPRPLPVVLVAPCCSISVAPRVFESRSSPVTPPESLGLFLPPLLLLGLYHTALSSHGARLAWLAAPLRVSQVPQPLLPPRPVLGRQVRSVVPQAPLKHGNAGGTSIAAELDALPSVECGVRFSLKPSPSRAMWAWCADSSSDDDEHNTSNTCSTCGLP